jgi:putative peptidoglycan lipid II flippase
MMLTENGSSPGQSTRRSAALVAIGILCSRLAGLFRQRVFAHYFGLSAPADAFSAAIRIPNFLNNLFGEGALSASFIPVYAGLLSRNERAEADRVAGAVASLLALLVTAVVLAGVLLTPLLIAVIAPGFTGATRDLTIRLVRILFPAVGLTVMSAWCLGVLNSHHRFLLSYAAPVVWNAAMIATLLLFGGTTGLPRLSELLAWGSVAGSALMVTVQLPAVFSVAPRLSFAVDIASDHVRTIVRNFGPVFVSRGVVQLSGYIDTLLATLVSTGATTALANAQTLYLLPVSLFGMSVSAAELPTMSGIVQAAADAHAGLRARVDNGLRQIAFFVVPSAVAFLALGDVIAAAVFQTGRFTHADAVYVWAILAGSAVGLLASTIGRLYSSTYYALRDTSTPLRYAIIRVLLTTVLGYLFAFPLPRWLGAAPAWGAAGLTASAGVAGWVEMLLLRSSLNTRMGRTGLPARFITQLWVAALAGAAVAWAIKLTFFWRSPIFQALFVLGAYALVYVGVTSAWKVPEASGALRAVIRRR